MIFNFGQIVNAFERSQEHLRLSWRSPVRIRLVLLNCNAEQCYDDVGGQCGLPIHHKHDNHAKDGAGKRGPHAVVFVLRPPARRLGEADVDHAQVDEAVSGHEEVWEEAWHLNRREAKIKEKFAKFGLRNKFAGMDLFS